MVNRNLDDIDVGERYYSVREFAKKLGVTYLTVLRSIKSGRINAFKVGAGPKSCYRIAQSETNRLATLDLMEKMSKLKNVEKKNDT